jgi:hypothetical protein
MLQGEDAVAFAGTPSSTSDDMNDTANLQEQSLGGS